MVRRVWVRRVWDLWHPIHYPNLEKQMWNND
jgi:hypothetical protein